MADIKIFTNMIEDEAKKQIDNIASHPAFSDCEIRIMPDVHAGKGCVCGFTADLKDKVVPNLIGVDIGCGVLCINLGNIDIDFKKLDDVIKRYIPSGKNVNDNVIFDNYPKNANPRDCIAKFNNDSQYEYFDRAISSLGGGNHFIEIDIDDEGNKYLLIHCGSRNFGKKVCEYWQQVAKDDCLTIESDALNKIIENIS